MIQKVSIYTIIDKLIKSSYPLQVIVSIDILITIVTKEFGKVCKHALSQIFGDASGRAQVRPAVALDELSFAVCINHDVPAEDDESVHAPLHLVVAGHRSHADDRVDRQQQFVPLFLRK